MDPTPIPRPNASTASIAMPRRAESARSAYRIREPIALQLWGPKLSRDSGIVAESWRGTVAENLAVARRPDECSEATHRVAGTKIRASPRDSDRDHGTGERIWRERVQCAGDGTRSDGSSASGFGTRVVLTAFVFIRVRGTGIATAAASGPSSSGAAW